MEPDTTEVAIIGAGPAGLSAAEAAAQAGLDYIVIEKGTIANTIRQYPVGRTMFSTPNEVEMHHGALKPVREKPTREEMLSHYIHFVLDLDLKINTDEEVVSVQGNIDDEQWDIFKLAFLTTGRIAVLSDQEGEGWMYDYRFLEAVR